MESHKNLYIHENKQCLKMNMILDLLADHKNELSSSFVGLFSRTNLLQIYPDQPMEVQVSEIEERLGKPSIQHMLIYSKKYLKLGTVLSRRYLNSARIQKGPLRLKDVVLLPDHLSSLPTMTKQNRVLFLAPHCDEAYLAGILLHRAIGDEVFLYSFTRPQATKKSIEKAYRILGLEKDNYFLSSLQANRLFTQKNIIRETIRHLLQEFDPTVVLSVFPKGANFDHMAVADATREVVLSESKADLLYGYVIQSRNKTPIIFPLFPKSVHRTILRAFGKNGLGKVFENYLPFLEHYIKTYSEPLLRMIGDKRLSHAYSLPLEGERITNYRIPNLLNEVL